MLQTYLCAFRKPQTYFDLSPKGRVKKKAEESVTFSTLGGGRGGWRWHSLGDFFATQKPFVCLKKDPKQTLCSLLTSDMLDIASNSVL